MLFVAMSALQGRPQRAAFTALAALDVDGIQLTPGNLPEPGFEALVRGSGLAFRPHHGFAWEHYRAEVHDAYGRTHARPLDWSVHPPRSSACAFERWLGHAREDDLLCEGMYPGYHLGSGAELARAMDEGLRLAIDTSHLHLQQCAGVIPPDVVRRLLDYDRLDEVHVSDNEGRADSHKPITATTPHLDWARARLAAGAVVVYESYLHRLDDDARRRQIELLRGRP